MVLPSYTADHSLYRSQRTYASSSSGSRSRPDGGVIVPQQSTRCFGCQCPNGPFFACFETCCILFADGSLGNCFSFQC